MHSSDVVVEAEVKSISEGLGASDIFSGDNCIKVSSCDQLIAAMLDTTQKSVDRKVCWLEYLRTAVGPDISVLYRGLECRHNSDHKPRQLCRQL